MFRVFDDKKEKKEKGYIIYVKNKIN